MLSANDKINMSLDDIIKIEKRQKKASTSKKQNGPNAKHKAVKKGLAQKNAFKKGPNKPQKFKKGRFQGNKKRFTQKNQKAKKDPTYLDELVEAAPVPKTMGRGHRLLERLLAGGVGRQKALYEFAPVQRHLRILQWRQLELIAG
ncbi:hypothetical protein QR680_016568 [Steinernema hermaphroditum]|uniref:Uncharacterized protein n=1 Tax=Steinernema hermaphroditum TaxID=289476 RepID=A0AA39HBZ3_9BILA|nr:hypothetical protein QR680_016568 [Steinernema hermaphroditum]